MSDTADPGWLARRGLGLLGGLVFGAGLLVSGMTRPAKVTAFLDATGLADGRWDGALAFVMVGAIGTYALAVQVAHRWERPTLAPAFSWPSLVQVDRRLILGSVIFGIGWGIAGYCPGPALVAVGAGSLPAAWFTGAMAVGMLLYRMRFRD